VERGDRIGRAGPRLDGRLVDRPLAVEEPVLPRRQLDRQAADQHVLRLHHEGVARPEPHVPEPGGAVGVREVLLRRADVVEMLVVALVDDRQAGRQGQAARHAVGEIDLDQRVLRPDLAVMVRQEDAVLEIDLRRQHLPHVVRAGHLPAHDDVSKGYVDRDAPRQPDPLLRPGHQEAVGRPARRPRRRRAGGEHDDAERDGADGRTNGNTIRPKRVRQPAKT